MPCAAIFIPRVTYHTCLGPDPTGGISTLMRHGLNEVLARDLLDRTFNPADTPDNILWDQGWNGLGSTKSQWIREQRRRRTPRRCCFRRRRVVRVSPKEGGIGELRIT
ncbi:hypothetical protein ABW19_dt0203095 [Dactylella cylindrospora]|nr:hypothetical protein ABW19_dt0203095 [Dactylella cylindrospora]